MKKLILLFTVSIIIVSCKNEPKIDYALFSGTITNPVGEEITVSGTDFNQKITVNKEGVFADTLKITPGYYSFSHGRESSTFYLTSGYNLNLTLDTKEFDETITYNGEGSENNNYLAFKYLYNEENSADVPVLYAMEQPEFLEAIKVLSRSNNEFLSNAEILDTDFIALEKESNSFDYLLNLQQYKNYHEYFAKKENVEVSEDFTKPFKGFDYGNDANYKSFASYKSLVQNHYSAAIKDSDDASVIFEELKSIDASALKEDLVKMLNYNIRPTNEKNEELYNGIMALSTDEEFKTKLTTKYKKVKLLAKGMASPIFTNYENHKGGETSLEDLKGKYVYVDVWATWCGPCKREIPFLKEVEASYHGKNIEFVSTSIDRAKDYEAWVNMVNDKALGGIQLFADSDWKSKFVQDYAIEGIPRFILIDPEGNIVTADAPRPSDPKLVDLFEELGIK
ncbi:TlpA family protein disulfide reductase [Flavobacteriaceae bacterium PRS1]|nr:TlpA family protein disulfide reductase [Flavobacteriaceae bacterium PRS1]